MTGEKLQDVCQFSTNGAGMVHHRERLMGQTDKQPHCVCGLKGQYGDYTIEGVWVSSSSLKLLIKLVAQTSVHIWNLQRWTASAMFCIPHCMEMASTHLQGNQNDYLVRHSYGFLNLSR